MFRFRDLSIWLQTASFPGQRFSHVGTHTRIITDTQCHARRVCSHLCWKRVLTSSSIVICIDMILPAVNGHLTECPNYGEDLCHLNQKEEIFLYIYTENVSGF